MSTPRLLPAYQCPPVAQENSRAVLVPRIREAVHQWRRAGYPGVTDTTAVLLRHWFETDHQVESSGEAWLYYYCQREAVETTVYLHEVLKRRSLYDLMRDFVDTDSGHRLSLNPLEDRWVRYAYKMATGSGKTKVMSLLIAWSYFNALRESDSNCAKTFLILAPNVIVYERLKQDFGDDGKIFREDPVIPPEWLHDWQLEVVTRDEPSDSVYREGALFLTNVQQLYDRPSSAGRHEPRGLRDLIGDPVVDSDVSAGRMIRQALERRDDLMVLNDEGHHVHDRGLRWWESIESLHEGLRTRVDKGLSAQLDFSATPKHNDGTLFNHVIVDYPIAQAIRDGVVKHPHLVILEGASQYTADNAADRYRDKLTAGIDRWRELRDRMKNVDREPLLFIMTEDTKSADEISDWLSGTGGFSADEVLTIHTNTRGEITETASASKQREISMLRSAAREVDSEHSTYRVIVSVLMLREGWDVRNVCVIVPLRPYRAAAQILPEQTLGRGLRRMFALSAGDEREELLVIEHDAFRSFWEEEIDGELIPIVATSNDKFKQSAETVMVDRDKVPEYEIEIPRISLRLSIVTPDLSLLDIHKLERYELGLHFEGVSDTPIRYTTREMDTWEVVDQGEIEREFPMSEAGYLNYMCRLILRECHLSNLAGGFAQLAPKVKNYIEEVMLSGQMLMSERDALYALNRPNIKEWIFGVFVNAVRELSVEEHSGDELHDYADPILVSDTRPYVTRRLVMRNPRRSVFDNVPGASELELDFARWLDREANDVAAFAKNEEAVGFNVNYVGPMGGIRRYIPDFIVRSVTGVMYVIETKGLPTEEVPLKDARMREWCNDATRLTGVQWRYIKVMQDTFMRGRGSWSLLEELAG